MIEVTNFFQHSFYAIVNAKSNFFVLLLSKDPEVPFVPSVEMDDIDGIIPCRSTNPHSHVILRNLQNGDEVSAMYDPKMGFIGIFAPGPYACETRINGKAVQSETYNVPNETGKQREFTCISICMFRLCGLFVRSKYKCYVAANAKHHAG